MESTRPGKADHENKTLGLKTKIPAKQDLIFRESQERKGHLI
jgi:hypothetical protein